MILSDILRKFICDHSEDDLSELLLSASRYRDVDVKTAVGQIRARSRIKEKLPLWYDDDRLFFPSVLAAEQSSSELTALYKQRLIKDDDCLGDLTGGLGVDTYFFSKKAKSVIYVEKNEMYCDVARYNMDILGAKGVNVINADATEVIANNDSRISGVNVFYIDPSRRGEGNKRMFAIDDCEPDLSLIWPLLCKKKCRVIVKLSPMLDITQVLTQFSGICEVHVVSVKNDCKELLLVAGEMSPPEPDIICVNYTYGSEEQSFRFRLQDEQSAVVSAYGFEPPAPERYLYEPNSSILKAGAFKSIALHFGVRKLQSSSHLYTSDFLVTSFPGRIFKIKDILPFNSRLCKKLSLKIPRANITVRNFPLSVDELRKRMRIKDGGDIYLFATTLSDSKKVIISCMKKITTL